MIYRVFLLCFALFFVVISNVIAEDLEIKKSQCTYDISHGYADLVEKILPSVVNISSSTLIERPMFPFEQFFGMDIFPFDQDMKMRSKRKIKQKSTSLGSGFFIDEKHVVTNYHVIKDATDVKITTYNKKDYKASIVGFDEKSDLAVLKISGDVKDAKPVAFGSSDMSRIGDIVFAIGNPFGLGGSVTHGIISAKARSLFDGSYDHFIQIDAAINRGNSGGPVFNPCNEVIGISTALVSNNGGNVGIGFAIASDNAVPIIQKLKNKQKIIRGWLGVEIQQITDEMADALGLKESGGIYVNNVVKSGPAEKGGLESGDVIIDVDGKKLEPKSISSYISSKKPGDAIKLKIIRNEKKMTLSVTLEELKQKNEEKKDSEKFNLDDTFGLEVETLTDEKRRNMSIPSDISGVIIIAIENKALINFAGIREGDVLTSVNNHKINSASDLKSIAKQIKSSKKKHVIFKLYKQDGSHISIGVPIN